MIEANSVSVPSAPLLLVLSLPFHYQGGVATGSPCQGFLLALLDRRRRGPVPGRPRLSMSKGALGTVLQLTVRSRTCQMMSPI